MQMLRPSFRPCEGCFTTPLRYLVSGQERGGFGRRTSGPHCELCGARRLDPPEGLRWRSLFAPPSRPSVKVITHANLIGYLFNTILPTRAGEAARVIAIRRAGGSPAEATGKVVVEGVYDVLSLLVLLFVTTPWLPHVRLAARGSRARGG